MNVFNTKLLSSQLEKECKHRIGVDAYDENKMAFCLVRHYDDKADILLCKTSNNKKDFWKEVKNLAKYFSAEIIEEK